MVNKAKKQGTTYETNIVNFVMYLSYLIKGIYKIVKIIWKISCYWWI